MKEQSDTAFYSISKEDVILSVETDIKNGLSETEVAARLKQFGNNSITENKKVSSFIIFLNQLKNPIVILLLLAAGLSFWFKEWLDGLAILIVIVINAIIGFYMEYQAERSMQALKKLAAAPAKVIRENQLKETDSENIVPGDIIFVEAGDLIPADGRIFSLSQLQADESALTGESVPIEKQTAPVSPDTILAERINMLYKGTFISKGNAYMIATATGMSTELGKVASLVQSADQAITPLEKKLEDFSKKLIKITIALVIIIFIAGLLEGQRFIEILGTSIALAVAAIPEGLPIVATIALAQGMIKMARHNVIVKKLSAVETLGSTNVICADKTGTLTKNKIEVKELFPSSQKAKTIIKNISILCNTAGLYRDDNVLKEIGDPLETGLLKFFSEKEQQINELRTKFPKIKEEPFSSETKMMATLHKTEQGCIVYAKGAVEELLACSNKILEESGENKLDDKKRQNWLKKSEELAASGMRIIATGYKQARENEKKLAADLVFTGLIGMIDPPREEVSTAIEECHSAGITIIMITGDHPSTAKNIARQLKITSKDDTAVVLGKDMKAYEQLSEEDKNTWVKSRVFARVSPIQKLDIVKVLQENKFTVAMTGDGINDAPALKKADIGIAMGQRGTQVAQEVADMIIKDDSFASIVLAVHQGRIIFENIRKFVIYLLSCNLSELFVISIASVFNLHFQLFPLQILFINIITDVLPALALGITPENTEVMKKPPRSESDPIIDKKRWWTIIFYSLVISVASIGAVLWSHFIIHKTETWNTELSNNILFFTLIFSQLLHVLNMGNTGTSFFKSEVFRNKYVWYSIIVSVALLFVLYLLEPLREVLSIHRMSMEDLWVCISASLISLIIIQIAKAFKFVKQ